MDNLEPDDSNEEFDIDAELAKTFDEIEARDSQEDTEPTRERDEHGRFKAKSSEDTVEEVTEPAEQPAPEPHAETPLTDEQPTEASEDVSEGGDPESNRPPSTWRAAAKAEWEKLPDVIRAEISKREDDFGNGISKYKQTAEYGEQIQQIIAPYMPMIQAEGGTPERAIQSLFNTAYQLRTGSPQQKGALIRKMAEVYGADLGDMGQPEPADPNYQHLQQQVQSLQQTFQQREQAFQQEQVTQAQQNVMQFQNATDEKGNAKYPYFENVRADMADLIDAAQSRGQHLSLEQAYNKACRANDEVYNVIQSQEFERRMAEKEAAQKAHAQKAAVAAQANVSTDVPAHEYPHSETASIDETLEDVYNRIVGN